MTALTSLQSAHACRRSGNSIRCWLAEDLALNAVGGGPGDVGVVARGRPLRGARQAQPAWVDLARVDQVLHPMDPGAQASNEGAVAKLDLTLDDLPDLAGREEIGRAHV